jgi:hypothetical protein
MTPVKQSPANALPRFNAAARIQPGLVQMLKRVCVSVFLLVAMGCSSDSVTSPAGSVTVTKWSLAGCTTSAAPLPGSRNCPGTVTLSITRTIPSGIVSVYFNYPDNGAFYHGELQVGSGIPGTVVVNVVNDYESTCVTSFATTFDVYDGAQSAQSAPLLVSQPVTLNVTCS